MPKLHSREMDQYHDPIAIQTNWSPSDSVSVDMMGLSIQSVEMHDENGLNRNARVQAYTFNHERKHDSLQVLPYHAARARVALVARDREISRAQ